MIPKELAVRQAFGKKFIRRRPQGGGPQAGAAGAIGTGAAGVPLQLRCRCFLGRRPRGAREECPPGSGRGGGSARGDLPWLAAGGGARTGAGGGLPGYRA